MTLPMVPILSVNDVQLHAGTIKVLFQDNKGSSLYTNPRLQIIHVKKLNTVNPNAGPDTPSDPVNDRYRVILSDGTAYMQAMLGIQCNELAAAEIIKTNCVVTLRKFSLSVVKDRKILIILDVDGPGIVHVDGKIGMPVNVEEVLGLKTAPTNPITTPANTLTSSEGMKPVAQPSTSYNPYASRAPEISAHSMGHSEEQNRVNPYSRSANTSNANVPSIINANAMTSGGCNPISSLSPYSSSWTLKARVTSKTEIKTWINAKGTGQLFSANLVDESGEIRVTGFNDAVTIFYPLFEVGKVIRLAKASVKLARKIFSNIDNQYEIHLEKDSIVTPVNEKDLGSEHIPTLRFNFTVIQDISSFQKDENVDVIGIVRDIGDLISITTKASQKQLSKRDITLVDSSLASIRITLWGKQAEDAVSDEWNRQPVLALKGVRVSDYGGGRSLSVSNSSVLYLNPDIAESHEVRGWYDTIGISSTFTNLTGGIGNSLDDKSSSGGILRSLTDRAVIQDIRNENLGAGDKADYIDFSGMITFIKSDGPISYPACPGSDGTGSSCQKKITEIGPNVWRCEKCARNYDAPLHRYIFSVLVSDFTGQSWLNVFNEVGEIIFQGKSASELVELKETDPDSYLKIIKDATFSRYIFRVRIKNEIYQGEAKSRSSIIGLSTPDYNRETKLMIDWMNSVSV